MTEKLEHCPFCGEPIQYDGIDGNVGLAGPDDGWFYHWVTCHLRCMRGRRAGM